MEYRTRPSVFNVPAEGGDVVTVVDVVRLVVEVDALVDVELRVVLADVDVAAGRSVVVVRHHTVVSS